MVGKYLVVVYPPPPATRGIGMEGVGTTTLATPPRVLYVDARFPADAAEKADVQPGGYCIVVTDAERFDRAAQAPLENKALDGNPLPVNADA